MGYLTLIRPWNCAMTAVSVFVGAWVGQGITWTPALVVAGAVGALACAFGNITNDMFDIDVDRVNRPGRSLVAGRATMSGAAILAGACAAAAIVGAVSLGALATILVAVVLVLLLAYNILLKRTPAGNVIVALVAATACLFGGITVPNLHAVIPFIFAFMLHLARELVKDLEDVSGDRARNVRSLGTALGGTGARTAAILLVALVAVAVPVPFLLRVLGRGYLLVMLGGAYPLMIYVVWRLHRDALPERMAQASRALKLLMGVGLVALVIG